MTREEFANTEFYHGIKAKYKGKIYNIESVDFDEDLIALDMIEDYDSDEYKIQWVRCENCEIIEDKTSYPESGLSDYELELEKIVEKIKDLTIIESIALLKNKLRPQRPVNPSTEPVGLTGAFVYITFLILGIALGFSIGVFT